MKTLKLHRNVSRKKELEVIYAEPFEHEKGKDPGSKPQAGRAPKPSHSYTTESLLPPDYFELEKPPPPNNNVGRQVKLFKTSCFSWDLFDYVVGILD